MKDLFRSRGFWVLLSTILATLAVQFPETEGWVKVVLPIIAALASYFGVTLERQSRGLPTSFSSADRERRALAQIRAKGK